MSYSSLLNTTIQNLAWSPRAVKTVCFSYLKLEADKHGQEHKAQTEETDGEADQPPEHISLPGRVIELLTPSHGTIALHALLK